MRITIKNGNSIDISMDEEGIKGVVKSHGFEFELDSTWEDLDNSIDVVRRVPRRARGARAYFDNKATRNFVS